MPRILPRAFINRDMLLAGCVELASTPIAPPMTQPQAGKLSHQVQLRGPAISDLDRIQPHSIVEEHDELAFNALRHGIVKRSLQADTFGCHFASSKLLAAVEAAHIRNKPLDHECPVGPEMRGYVLKTSHLLFLCHQSKERVEHDED